MRIRSASIVTSLFVIFCSGPYGVLLAMDHAYTNSEISQPLSLRISLPDGNEWTLNPDGTGRPFAVRMLITNHGDKTVQLWDPKNSEGSQNPAILLVDSKSVQHVLQPPPIERSGLATTITIGPNQISTIELELLRLIGKKTLHPGAYQLIGIYENKLPHSVKRLWSGRIESEPASITIIGLD